MVLIRRIFVAVIAISIATLPAAAEAVVLLSPVAVMMPDEADMPCCPACDSQGNIKAAMCVLKCAALASAVLPAMTVALPYLAHQSPRSPVDDTLHGLVRAPPTHPPPA